VALPPVTFVTTLWATPVKVADEFTVTVAAVVLLYEPPIITFELVVIALTVFIDVAPVTAVVPNVAGIAVAASVLLFTDTVPVFDTEGVKVAVP
jgi:hypothetical protein